MGANGTIFTSRSIIQSGSSPLDMMCPRAERPFSGAGTGRARALRPALSALTPRASPRIYSGRMLFTTAKFLAFFAVAFSVYWLLGRHRWRLVWLTAASAFFYACWRWEFLFLILASTSVDYFVALRLQRVQNPRARKWLV